MPVIPVNQETQGQERKFYLLPFILITSLFFLWGLANILNSALIAHFQPVFKIGRIQAMLVETAFYLGYFTFAIPAGLFMERFRYKGGILVGLGLYCLGALLFIPAAEFVSFEFFLFALYIIAAGLAFLETGANPYAIMLGPESSASFRINLAQTFNGLALIAGPQIAARMILSENESSSVESVVLPYTIIGVVVFVIAVVFAFMRLPEPGNAQKIVFSKAVFRFPRLMKGVLAQFLYVGAQAGIWGITINFVMDLLPGTTSQEASATYLFGGTLLFVVGRIIGTWLLSIFQPAGVLGAFGIAAVICAAGAVLLPGLPAVICLLATNLFMSIMFPTIFSLAIRDIGEHTKIGAALVIMAIVGGAVLPPVMAVVNDQFSVQTAILLPVGSFAYVAWFAFFGSKQS